MKKKTIVTSILASAFCTCAMFGVAACGNDDNGDNNKPAADITVGVYDGSYVGGGFTQEHYLRFHKEGDIFDGKQTFYFHAFSNGSGQSMQMFKPTLGTYEVLDQEITMKAFPSGSERYLDGTEPVSYTADKTVVFYDLDGTTEWFKTGWDTKNNKLLGIPYTDAEHGITQTNTMGVTSNYVNHCYLHSDKAFTDKAVEMGKYYCDTDDVRNASITIYHNNTYTDDCVTGSSAINGTYTVSGGTYTLTAGEGAIGGTLVVGETIKFTPTGREEITMSTTRNRAPVDGYTFTGEITLDGSDAPSNVTITLYDDNTIVVTGMGSAPIEGTWEANAETKLPDAISIGGGVSNYIEIKTDSDGTYYEISLDDISLEGGKVRTISKHIFTGTGVGGQYNSVTLILNKDGTAILDMERIGSTAYPKQHYEGTWTGRSIKLSANGQNLEMTITEGEDNKFVITGTFLSLSLSGVTAPAANQGGDEEPDDPQPVTTLYTLSGTMTGPNQTGQGTTSYEAALKLNSDMSFELSLTSDLGTASAAKGTFAPDTSTGNFILTVTESTFYAVGAKFTVTGEYNVDHSPKSLSVNLPEAKTTYPDVGEITVLNAATLSYSAVTTLAVLTGSTTGTGQDESGQPITVNYEVSMTLYSDGTFEVKYGEHTMITGTYQADMSTGAFTVTATLSAAQLSFKPDDDTQQPSNVTLTTTLNGTTPTGFRATIPDIGMTYSSNWITTINGVTLTYTLPQA